MVIAAISSSSLRRALRPSTWL